MTLNRRADRLGVHSIGEFRMTVPSLEDARQFYSTFGLDVQADGSNGLVIRTYGSPHVWGRLRQGLRKKFEWLTLHCFEDELEALKKHVQAQGVSLIAPRLKRMAQAFGSTTRTACPCKSAPASKPRSMKPNTKAPPCRWTGCAVRPIAD